MKDRTGRRTRTTISSTCLIQQKSEVLSRPMSWPTVGTVHLQTYSICKPCSGSSSWVSKKIVSSMKQKERISPSRLGLDYEKSPQGVAPRVWFCARSADHLQKRRCAVRLHE